MISNDNNNNCRNNIINNNNVFACIYNNPSYDAPPPLHNSMPLVLGTWPFRALLILSSSLKIFFLSLPYSIPRRNRYSSTPKGKSEARKIILSCNAAPQLSKYSVFFLFFFIKNNSEYINGMDRSLFFILISRHLIATIIVPGFLFAFVYFRRHGESRTYLYTSCILYIYIYIYL